MKKLLSFLFSRIFSIGVIILFQLLFILLIPLYFSAEVELINIALRLLSLVMAVYVLNKADLNPSYKMAWIIVILLFPLIGGMLYLLLGDKRIPKHLQLQHLVNFQKTSQIFRQNEKAMQEVAADNLHIHNQFDYLWRNTAFPTCDNNKVTYFSSGEVMFEAMLQAIKSAENFIFLEYFIIDSGYMWDSIRELLLEKAAAGVEIRLLYDDFGTSFNFPLHYDRKLQLQGINAKAFNPLRPLLAIQMNNRDHRKILIVDGKVAFTGGINLADEYINRIAPLGYWKDGGVKIVGNGVFNFTLMFLQMFEVSLASNAERYRYNHPQRYQDAIICPFGDAPTDNEDVGKSVHMNIINHALESIYITTPYLIIDEEMMAALTLAAKRGVEVNIVVPHIADKWYAHVISQSNYYYLLKNGVKIYEYTPGFIHTKVVLADDNIACVGTINLDFRSYYLHYECGVLIYRSACLKTIKQDLMQTITVSQAITMKQLQEENIFKRILQAILNMLSPMM